MILLKSKFRKLFANLRLFFQDYKLIKFSVLIFLSFSLLALVFFVQSNTEIRKQAYQSKLVPQKMDIEVSKSNLIYPENIVQDTNNKANDSTLSQTVNQSSIAIDDWGHTHLSWGHREITNPNIYNIYYSRSLDNGHTFTDERKISYSDIPSDKNYSPRIATYKNFVFIVYETWENASKQEPVIKFVWSSDHGDTFSSSSNIIVSDVVVPQHNGTFMSPQISVDDDGKVYIVWQVYRNNGPIDSISVFFTSSVSNNYDDGFNDPKMIAESEIGLEYPFLPFPQITTTEDLGTIYVAWLNRTSVPQESVTYIMRSNDFGDTFSESIPVFERTNVQFNTQRLPKLTFDNDANLLYIGWLEQNTDNTNFDIWISKSRDGAQTFIEPINVTDSSITYLGLYDWDLEISDTGSIFVSWSQRAYRYISSTKSVDNGKSFSTPIHSASNPARFSWWIDLVTGKDDDVYVVYASAYDVYLMHSQITQQLNFTAGWNWFSLYIDVTGVDIADIFSELQGTFLKIYGDGKVYLPPPFNPIYNTLHNLEKGQMYRIFSNENTTLNVTGNKIPVQENISLKQGWNWLGYYPQVTMPSSEALSSINGLYQSILSEDTGVPQPLSRSESGIDFIPGKGYMIYLNEAATLIYPPFSSNVNTNNSIGSEKSVCNVSKTSNFMHLYGQLPINTRFNKESKYYIRAINEKDEVVGCQEINSPVLEPMRIYGIEMVESTRLPGYQENEPVVLQLLEINGREKKESDIKTNVKFLSDMGFHLLVNIEEKRFSILRR